jgi:hypothetical protein
MEQTNHNSAKQVLDEIESWKCLLEFLQVENSYLKNGIAKVVSQEINRQILALAEDFQTRFMNLDEIIRLVRKDIHDFNSSIPVFSFNETTMSPEANMKLGSLRTEMEILAKRFYKLRSDFQHYIS